MSNLGTFNFTNNLVTKERIKGYKPKVIWFFGLSGSGKSTLSNEVEKFLLSKRIFPVQVDADDLRGGLNSDLGFSEIDRTENIRRVSEVVKLLFNNGLVSLCSFITPTEEMRTLINKIVGNENIIWVYLSAPLEICEKRDPKGLYKKARKLEIKNFTGISQDFEPPKYYDIVVNYNDNPQKSAILISDLILKIDE